MRLVVLPKALAAEHLSDHSDAFGVLPSSYSEVCDYTFGNNTFFNIIFSTADAAVAIGRIGTFLTAEELPDPFEIDPKREDAIAVDGDFQWEAANPAASAAKFQTGKSSGGPGHKKDEKPKKDASTSRKRRSLFGKKTDSVLPVTAPAVDAEKKVEEPFGLKNLELKIKKGSFVAIVGTVGSGKVCDSSLSGIRPAYSAIVEFIAAGLDR